MKISKILTNSDTLRELLPQEITLTTNVLKTNLQYKNGDSIFIVTDQNMLQQEAALWFETAKQLGSKVELFVIENMTHSGEEPPQEVIDKASKADISIFQTSHSLTHTRAGKAVGAHNKRGASLPGATYELMLRTLSIDYAPVKELGEKIKALLESHATITVTSEAGTNLTAKIRTDAIRNDSGLLEPGHMGNLPAGEVFFAPLADSANGTVVIDGSIANGILDEPIRIEVKDGVATSITGGQAAAKLEKELSQFGQKGLVVAEIGIGTNSAAKICPELIEAEKAYGTVHIAFGNSSSMGGENDVPIHIDGLVAEPVVTLDHEEILKKREFLLQ